MDRFSFLNTLHSNQVEEMYEEYIQNPDAVQPSWKAFFQGFDFAKEVYGDTKATEVDHSAGANLPNDKVQKEFKVIDLINGYRQRGHLFTKTNPVRKRRIYEPNLALENFDLSESDLEEEFTACKIIGLDKPTKLKDIIAKLELIYCNNIGIEYMYIRHPERVSWIQERLNINDNHPELTFSEKKHILYKLNQAVAFENFLHTKFVGQKRFSLEGGESLIPALDSLIEVSADLGVEEFVMGMAHRGRLNVLANIFNKTYSEIFSEFEGKEFDRDEFDGDVKYHLGSTTSLVTDGGKAIRLNLAPNPSHLETVDAIVQGIVRAKIDDEYKGNYQKVMPVLVHGDAAIAGQGIVYEVVQMMNLDGYKTGGTIHIVVNNQVGFTTNYTDARSSTYCTDIGKVTLSPILHINSDNVEAVVHGIRFAVEYRMKFERDVFIDLLGYRKYGHNEGDEPRFTQPLLYKAIEKHKNPKDIYSEILLKQGLLNQSFIKKLEDDFQNMLEYNFSESKKIEKNRIEPFMGDKWRNFIFPTVQQTFDKVDTTVEESVIRELVEKLTEVPQGNKLFKKVQRLLQARKKMLADDKMDWGMVETLAYASLLHDGHDVRISGEDVERGTFSHRHAVLTIEDTGEEVVPLKNISPNQGDFHIYNSHLSEYGVLGFDYGYAMATPNCLTVWEAQFGDFANGAQIIIDQYLSSAEDKWRAQCGLVLLLPHGYEGQGAEHSSARLERFLQLSAQLNMFVVNCTTPANLFHVLRKQMKLQFRKPLVIFTPKSLLRHPKVVSTVKDLSTGSFQVMYDDEWINKEKVERVILCSGKLYYSLLERQEEENNHKVALVRLEQLYPLPLAELETLLATYPNRKELYWAQEEPKNMGAWSHILRRLIDFNFTGVISPASSAAPATGSSARFKIIYQAIIDKVFDI